MDWYEAITSRNGSSTFGIRLGYKPDVDDIIEKYYIQLLRYINSKENEISKVFLIRECKTETPLIDLISIMFMYNIDLFSKLLTNLLEDYYESFSWEKIVSQNMQVRYDSIIAGLEVNIQNMKDGLESAKMQIQMLNSRLVKEKRDEVIPLQRLEADFEKKIESKNKEIEELKQKLESKDEFIELLENTLDSDNQLDKEVDIIRLQEKKYLFVGHIKEAMPELHRKFPNSLFMESENFSLSNTKIDGVVMLIKYMSHGMFYKIRSSKMLNNIPSVYCNTKNISTVYEAMIQIGEN